MGQLHLNANCLRGLTLLFAVWIGGLTAAAADDEQRTPQDESQTRHFELKIAPIFSQHCWDCHGTKVKKARLDLSRKSSALAGGQKGRVLVPGKSSESRLWVRIESGEMPPEGQPKLSEDEKRLLREWIDAGAAWATTPGAEGLDTPGNAHTRRLTVTEYIETVRSTMGVDVEAEARRLLPRDVRADGFSNTAYSLGIDLPHVEAYARLAELAVHRMDLNAFLKEHAPQRDVKDANLRDVVRRIGKWLLRGPLEEAETSAFINVAKAVVDDGGNFEEAMGYTIEAMLQSPRFLYRIEKPPGEGAASGTPSQFELASRLSYILWGAPPDRELMRAADSGELADRARIEAQVTRMLGDRRAIKRSSQFVQEWLDLDRLNSLRPSPDRFPHWDRRLATDMRDETLAFFEEVAWKQGRPLSDLFNAQLTFATPRLARHYGLNRLRSLPSESPQVPQRVRDGILALYSFREGSGREIQDVSDAGEPLDLTITDPAAVRWTEDGLLVQRSTLIASERPPIRMLQALKRSGGVTLEAWVTPANGTQSGPARILTLSNGISARNFTLAQDADKFDVRFRSTKSDGNGMPSLTSPARQVALQPTHVVYTREPSGRAKLYVNGKEVAGRDVGGDLSNWDEGFRLAIANELSNDRTWQGVLHLIAIYARALPAEDVARNYTAGWRPEGAVAPVVAGFDENFGSDLQVLYRFGEGEGTTVRDSAGVGEPIHLSIETASAVKWTSDGLVVQNPTRIASQAIPKRLRDAVKKSNALTLEAWITPADTRQNGPARILTLSADPLKRNFTLGQEEDAYDVRFRTTKSDANGQPSLLGPDGSVQTRPTHVVFTRDSAGKGKLYVNGAEAAARDLPGDLSNWDDSFQLALANEATLDRPWRGTFHGVAIYSRALAPEEIRANSAVRSGGLARYDLTNVPERGGLLTQGSVLTIGGDEASMVTRGLFVLRELLYSNVEDPPPCVDTTPVPPKPGQSQRAVAGQRIANQACAGCHVRFEPLAFGLEKLDGIGAFHEQDEHGNTLRDDGEILFPGEAQPVRYASSAEMMDLLARSDRIRRALTRKVTQFAIGRPVVESDEPILERIHEESLKNGGSYASLIRAIVMSDLVQRTHSETRL